MKKNLFVTIILAATVVAGLSAAELQKGIDMTAQTSVTGSQLNQLVDNATPATNRGFIYVSNAAPNTVTYPRFTNYLWLDQSALPYTLRSYQTGTWASASVGANSVDTGNIVNGAVTNPKLAANAVNTTNISDNAVANSKIAAGAVTTSKIGDLQITTTTINDLAVTTAKIADGAITAGKLAAGAVGPAVLGPQSVYGTNLVNGTITWLQIAPGTIFGTNIAGGTIIASNIAGAAISKTNLAFGTPTNFTATASVPAAAGTATMPHSFGAIPQVARVMLVCTSADINWSVGDEVNIEAFTDSSAANEPAFFVQIDATNVLVYRTSDAATVRGMNKTSKARASITTANWNVKVYAVYNP